VNFGRNQNFAPETFKILNKHKDVISAYISVLGPRKMLMPHEGPWSGILRMHLGVVIPGNNECTLGQWWREVSLAGRQDGSV
jgi:aspartyl/asparaginyl beta-hydroxylase (cupin superfamily)